MRIFHHYEGLEIDHSTPYRYQYPHSIHPVIHSASYEMPATTPTPLKTGGGKTSKNVQFTLRSPYHADKRYSQKDFQTTNSISFKPPVEAAVIEQKRKTCEQHTSDALKQIHYHLPPKFKVSGLPKREEPSDALKVYQCLSPRAPFKSKKIDYTEPLEITSDSLPKPRSKPWIGDNPFSSKNQLAMPHSSYDLNNDGVVSPKEYAIAKFFDKDRDGKLNKTERQNALNAIKKGIAKQYLFSAKGVHKLTEDELKSQNGGWMKHDITERENTRSRLLQKRKHQQSYDANKLAEDHWANKERNRIPKEFPFEFAEDLRAQKISKSNLKNLSANNSNTSNLKAITGAQTADIHTMSVLKNKKSEENKKRNRRFHSQSELFAHRHATQMMELEKSRAECEPYFQPVRFRKLDKLEHFLRERATHKSKKTMADVEEARHKENYNVGRMWESRTNFEIFNSKKMEKEFWANAYVSKENNQPVNKTSCEIYNMIKTTRKSVDTLPAPFQCPYDSLKRRDPRFLSNIAKEKEAAILRPHDRPQYQARDHQNFKEFSDKVGDTPDNLCVLHGGRKIGNMEEGVSSWWRPRRSPLNDTLPLYSSFTRDGVFREPTYGTTNKSRMKTNLFETTTFAAKSRRPKTAPVNNQTFSSFASSINYVKCPLIRTSGFA